MNDFLAIDREAAPALPASEGLADGVYIALPEADYHADPALSASGICDLLVSPETYWRNSAHNPKREDDDTPSLALGRYFHQLATGMTWGTAVKPEGMSFATKEGKAWRDEREGMEIVLHEIAAKAQAMFDAMRSATQIPFGNPGDEFLPEVSYFWTAKDGIRRKMRIDCLFENCSIDLKTFSNSTGKESEVALAHAVAFNRYHVKAAWYMEGIDHMRETVATIGNAAAKDSDTIDLSFLATADAFPHWFIFVEASNVPMIFKRRFTKYAVDGQVNGYWRKAIGEIETATERYRANAIRHGFARPWISTASGKSFDDADFDRASWIVERD